MLGWDSNVQGRCENMLVNKYFVVRPKQGQDHRTFLHRITAVP